MEDTLQISLPLLNSKQLSVNEQLSVTTIEPAEEPDAGLICELTYDSDDAFGGQTPESAGGETP